MTKTQRSQFGFVRIAVGSHDVEVGNCAYNTDRIIAMMKRAQDVGANFLVLNELGVTAYTCANHFRSEVLRRDALTSIARIVEASRTDFSGVLLVGAPIEFDGELFNCAVVVCRGKILGVVPKTYLPNAGEFHEKLWFTRGDKLKKRFITLCGQKVRIGTDLLFEARDFPGLVFGIEVCEDGWAVIPPHRLQALGGATVLFNLSASNELVAKDEYRRSMVAAHSAQSQAVYAYASAGDGESTTDLVYGGQLLIGELGGILSEAEPLSESEPFRYADVDVQHVVHERMRDGTFHDCRRAFAPLLDFDRIEFDLEAGSLPDELARRLDAYPFVPQDPETLNKRCRQVFKIQVRALKTRLRYLIKLRGGRDKVVADLTASGKAMAVGGISGGADSTQMLLVAVKAFDELGIPRHLLHCFTMPGFGTTSRTYNNAMKLMQLEGVTVKEVDIKERCLLAWRQEGKKPFGINLDGLSTEDFVERLRELPVGSQDLDFENKQARARTDILMNAGFVLGTGTLTELAAGWCTYNADHMSMYSVNPGVAKTLIALLIRWVAANEAEGELVDVLNDIAATAETPELLPVGKDGQQHQKSNDSLGPKDLRDFFLYHWVRWGSAPSKILYLTSQARFKEDYSVAGILTCLRQYVWRFITQRFKHSCQPDGVKLGSVSLNPRYDCHMPSDTAPDAFIAELEAYVAGAPSEIDWQPEGSRSIATTEKTSMSKAITLKTVKRRGKEVKVLRVLGRVDILDTFMPYGTLPVPDGHKVVPVANALSRSDEYDLVVDFQDAHPEDHGSFASQHEGKQPFADVIILNGVEQRLWTDHGIDGREGPSGNGFHPDLDRSMVAATFKKGQDKRVDSYSGLYDNGRKAKRSIRRKFPFLGKSTGFVEWLVAEAERLGADEIQVDLVGLALGYCVSWTGFDLAAEKFKGKKIKVRVVRDGVRALSDEEQHFSDLEAKNIKVVDMIDILPKLA
ncbi:MAG: NAD(+) synthase [Cyanobacteria bacterium HKST-UBA02]|nr:NAD(+) synthase [Cyanobacteria bacterium HKST-UBA02]